MNQYVEYSNCFNWFMYLGLFTLRILRWHVEEQCQEALYVHN